MNNPKETPESLATRLFREREEQRRRQRAANDDMLLVQSQVMTTLAMVQSYGATKHPDDPPYCPPPDPSPHSVDTSSPSGFDGGFCG